MFPDIEWPIGSVGSCFSYAYPCFLKQMENIKCVTISPPYDIYSLTKAKGLWKHILYEEDIKAEVVIGILCDYAIDWDFR